MEKRKLLFLLLMALLLPTAIKAQVALPYTCGFEEGDDLSGWSVYNMAQGGGISSEQQNSGDKCFRFYYTTNPSQYIISPELTGTENGVEFEFYYKAYNTQWGPETFKVGYTTSESNDVTDEEAWVWEDEVTVENTDYELYNTILPAGVKYVALACTSYDAFYLFVDDFSFKVPNACKPVKDVKASNITYKSAVISWTAGDEEQDQWQLSLPYTDASVGPDESHLMTLNTNSFTFVNLTPETTYYVAARAFCGGDSHSDWRKISFTTPVRFLAPSNVTADNITDTGADISWTAAGDETSWNLRYKQGFFVDAENGIPDGWTTIDDDGDGYNWYLLDVTNFSNPDGYSHSGNFVIGSASYISGAGALHPDNWLISPLVNLGGVFSFFAHGRDAGFAEEHFAIYVSTTGTNPSSFTQVSEEFVATGDWTEYSADLSAYAGKSGYIAIRHFNCSDMFVLDIDDISYTLDDWTVVEDVTNPYTLTGLETGTYTVEVQSVYAEETGSGLSRWTGSTFTTTNLKALPSDITADNVTTESADISWTVNGIETTWNLRYRQQPEGVGFESGELPEGWTTIDANSDGFDWGIFPPEPDGYSYGHNSNTCIASASYDNHTEKSITPDNWLISPEVTLEGTFSFFARAADPSYSDEVFAVFVSTDSNTDTSDFAQVSSDYTASGSWVKYTVDLNGFKGQKGYVAIRHYNCSNQLYLFVDDITFANDTDFPWTYVNDVTEQPVELTGLETGVNYEVQVQAVYDDGSNSEWVAGAFTTIVELALLDNDYEQPQDKKNTYFLNKYLNKEANVTLSGRKLYKDGSWNTLILPFSLSPEQLAASPLAGATVKYVASSSTVDGTHVTLNLSSYTNGIEAGYPYYLKWDSGEDITDPRFENVYIEEAEEPMLYMNSDHNILGIGFYSSYLLKPESELPDGEPLIYYLSADNQLRFTGKQRVINAFRHGLIFRNLNAGALTFTLNFEDGETTGIVEVDGKQTAAPAEGIYNLQGVKLNGQPKQKGVYINNGKKMVIK